ncbi:hypothetical protein Lal_00012521 [Lupinus albus]|uniref:Putative alpha-L-fucosidase n=1 Tax=Lupinus albus TaxID=3870 RepID=A0A6A4NJ97_LUPAL|nr:putative alpha-L-fucosidase [Lupinus albus]KAF1883607.1 hypothetical protein Lal_00012521 [Lupinus albus]
MGNLKEIVFVMMLLSTTRFMNMNGEEVTYSKVQEPCNFAAIFNFGDSNSDTGCMAAAFYPEISPYGQTFFNEPVGRASDGRLIIDFIAKHLGFPFLSAYINSIGTSYRNGANFAAGSSTILRQNKTYFDGGTPFTLEIQTQQFNQFKARTGKLLASAKNSSYINQFPRPEEFAKAIYTLDIGQNDIAAVINNGGKEDFKVVVSNIIQYFSNQVQLLHGLGARTFWIHNTGPIGCLPVNLPMHNAIINPQVGYLDQNGCVKYQNEMAIMFNQELKNLVIQLRTLFSDASFTYVDIFSAKYHLISNAKQEGFVEAYNICCGYHKDGYHLYCGNKAVIKGKEIFAGSCKYPSKHISWDGVHYTDAANQWIANQIINGSFSDPPFPITHSCQITH